MIILPEILDQHKRKHTGGWGGFFWGHKCCGMCKGNLDGRCHGECRGFCGH